MSYAAPFSLLSFHLPDHDDSVEERLTWPLAGSLVIHACVFIAFLSLRFASSFEQSSGSYEVTLVTLPEITASPTVSPENKSRPKRSADKVPPPKAKAQKAAKVAPQRKAVSPPTPVPQEKPRVPERVTDSLVGALDSVVVPKPQTLSLPQKAAPLLPPPLPPLPVSADPKPTPKSNVDELPRADDAEAPEAERVTESLVGALDSVVVPKPQAPALPPKAAPVQDPAPPPVTESPALEMEVQPPIQAPPQPPKLVVGKSETPVSTPRAELLAQKLKQRVDAIVVPKKPKQVASHVSPTVRSDVERKQDTTRTPESPRITLPRRAPRLAAVAPPEAPKREAPLQTARKSNTVESLTRAIQSVRVPEKISKSETPQPVSAAPLIPDASPTSPKAAEARNRPERTIIPPPSAPELTKMPVEQTPVALQPAVPRTTPESDTFKRRLDEISIPEVAAFDAQFASKQTESGMKETLGLRVAGFCSQKNRYWKNVEKKIDKIHEKYWKDRRRVEYLANLTFRVERNGRVVDLAVARSSGNKKFDVVAKRAVLAAAPLPSFPANVPKSFCTISHKFTSLGNR